MEIPHVPVPVPNTDLYFPPPHKRLAHVYGPPGSGKSCATWYWAHTRARAAACVMAYVHCDIKKCNFTDVQGQTSVVAFEDLESTVFPGGCYRRAICILDQALAKNVHDLVGTILHLAAAGAVVILVSSEGLRLNEGSFSPFDVIDHRFPGWSLDELKFACQYRPFFDTVKVQAFGANAVYEDYEELVEEKFFVAGHSARYMFTKSLADVVDKITQNVAELEPNLKVITNALKSPKCFGAVNSLMPCLDACNGRTPVLPSPFLHVGAWPAVDPIPDDQGRRSGCGINHCFVSVRAAQEIITTMFFSSADLRAMGLKFDVPGIVGYAFQQRFLEFANEHAMLQTPARPMIHEIPEDWEIRAFSHKTPLERLQQAGNALPGLFFWCVAATAAYDAILIYADGRIRFIQVTTGVSHSFKICRS